jgi:hypothetical protein
MAGSTLQSMASVTAGVLLVLPALWLERIPLRHIILDAAVKTPLLQKNCL